MEIWIRLILLAEDLRTDYLVELMPLRVLVFHRERVMPAKIADLSVFDVMH